MRVALLDNEQNAIMALTDLLEEKEDIEIVGKYTCLNDLMQDLVSLKPDLLFLAIEIGSDNGLEAMKDIRRLVPNIRIVIASAYAQHALRAFEEGAIDYLLKPISEKRLNMALDKVRELMHIAVERDKALSIKTMSSFHLALEDGYIIQWRTRKAKELFVYLWLNSDISVSRDVLIEKIFDSKNYKQSSTLLSTTLYQMRSVLSEYSDKDFVKYLNNGYRFKVDIPSDYQTIKEIAESKDYTVENYRTIQKIYTGNFLEEEGYVWSKRYAEQLRLSIEQYLTKLVERVDEKDTLLIEDIMLFAYNLDVKDENIAMKLLDFYHKHDLYSKFESFFRKHFITAESREAFLASQYGKYLVK